MEWTKHKKTKMWRRLFMRLVSFLCKEESSASASFHLQSSQLRIPILVNTIHVTEQSTQTPSIHFDLSSCSRVTRRPHRRRRSRRSRHAKYHNRFSRCLEELLSKCPRLAAHDEVEVNVLSRSTIHRVIEAQMTFDDDEEKFSSLLVDHQEQTRREDLPSSTLIANISFKGSTSSIGAIREGLCDNFNGSFSNRSLANDLDELQHSSLHENIGIKLIETREDLARLNATLKELEQRLERLWTKTRE